MAGPSRYIPTERRPYTPSTMQLFTQSMQPMLNMYLNYTLQSKMATKQAELQNIYRQQAIADATYNRRIEAGWTPQQGRQLPQTTAPTGFGQVPTGRPGGTIQTDWPGGRAPLRPPTPKVHKLEGGGRIFTDRGISKYIPPTKASDFDKKYALWQAGEITQDQFLGIKPETTAADIKKYNLYTTQEMKAGRVPKDFTPWLKSVKRAGAPSMTQIVSGEKWEEIKKAEAADLRIDLIKTNKRDKSYFDAQAPRFNNLTAQNEVAYWNTSGWWEQSRVVKLSAGDRAKGLTPALLQNQVTRDQTMEDLLKKLGIIK